MSTERIGVIGLGLLGRGITACFLVHGFQVVAVARSQERHAEARRHIDEMVGALADLGGFDVALRQEWTARYTAATDLAELGNCSFVVESVLEDTAAKHEVLDKAEAVLEADTVIASNSSAIPISQLQARRKHPERVVAMHWAEPAHAARLLELIRGEHTSDTALERTVRLARRLGKEPSLCQKEVPGFIVNRIGYAMYREALNLLESGVADVETIDRSVRNAFGLWATVCGPFRWMDLTGGPELHCKAMTPVLPTLSRAQDPPPSIRKLAEVGARGIANGRGFFNYTPEEARFWEALYRRHAWRVAQMQDEYFPLVSREPVPEPGQT